MEQGYWTPITAFARKAASALTGRPGTVLIEESETLETEISCIGNPTATSMAVPIQANAASAKAQAEPIPLSDINLNDMSVGSSAASSALSVSEEFDVEHLPIYSLEEVKLHCDPTKDAWMILYDRIYDVTNFINMHPGGQDVIYECLGLDATNAFRSAGHSEHAFDMLDLHCPLVGILPKNERMWNKKLRY